MICNVSEPGNSYTSNAALLRLLITAVAIERCFSFSRSRSFFLGSFWANAATVIPVGDGAACIGTAGGRFACCPPTGTRLPSMKRLPVGTESGETRSYWHVC